MQTERPKDTKGTAGEKRNGSLVFRAHDLILRHDGRREPVDVSYDSMSIRVLTNALKWPQVFSKTIRSLTIATHDRKFFDCDEVLGVWLVKQTDRFRDASILRTQDSSLLDKADVVIDVGGVHDPRQLDLCVLRLEKAPDVQIPFALTIVCMVLKTSARGVRFQSV